MTFSETYPLKPFQVHDRDKLLRLVAEYPLATVISQNPDFPTVSQLPLMHDPATNLLRGHVDRNNPHCELLGQGGNVYCLFQGPNHYISPAIYPDTQFPGWNYIAVHVEGTVRPVEDRDWLVETLLMTAAHCEPADSGYELSRDQANFDKLLDYIVGIEIEIADMRGIFKLAQDKGPAHVELARDHLAEVSRKDLAPFLRDMLDAG